MDAGAAVESSPPIGARPQEATLGDVEVASRAVRPSRNVARLVPGIAALVAAIVLVSAAAVLHVSNKAERDELRKRLVQIEAELQSAAAGNQHTAEQLLAARTELSQTNAALGKAHGALEASAERESKLTERLAEAKAETDAARAAERQARVDGTIDRQQLQSLLDKERLTSERLSRVLEAKDSAKSRNVRATEQVDQLDYLRRVGLAYAAWRDGQMYVARRALAECPAERRHWEWQFVDRLCNSELSQTKVTNDLGFAFDVGWTRTAQVGHETTVMVQHKNAPERDLLLKGHATAVRGIAFSLDGSRIATVSNDRIVKVWNADTGEEIKTLAAAVETRGTSFRFVGIDARGARVASSGNDDGLIRAWDVESGREVFSQKAYVHSLDLSPDGTQIAGATMGSIKIWDVATGTETLSVEWPGQAAQALAFSPDGKRLAAARDGHIRLCDVTTGKPALTLEGHRYVLRLAFSRDGKQLASVGDGMMRIWDVTAPQEVGTLGRYLDHLSFSPDGRTIAGSSYADHGVVIRDVETAKDLRIIKPALFQVMRVAFSPDWKRAALVGYGRLAIWDVESGKELVTLIAPPPQPSLPGRPLPTRKGAGGAKTPMVPAPAPAKADKPAFPDGEKAAPAPAASPRGVQNIQSMAFSPDGKQLVTADHSIVQLWDVEAGREIRELNRGMRRPVVVSPKGLRDLHYSPSLVAFAPHGKCIATAGGNQVKLWDPATGVELTSIGAEVGRFTCLTFSPNGERVVAGSSDGLIEIWNAEDGKLVFTLLGHTQDVVRLSFHADGTRLVSAGRDGTIKVWDAENGLEALTLLGHTKAVDNVAFSPDGLRIASSSHDNTLRIWDARPRNWRAESLPPK